MEELKRIQGYLVIDDCDKKIANAEKGHYRVYINGEEYYFKPALFAYNELIAYYGAQMLGIDACYYDLATLNGELGYISKIYGRNAVKLVPGEEILSEYLEFNIKNGTVQNIGIPDSWINHSGDSESSISVADIEPDDINNLLVIKEALIHKYGPLIDIDKVMEKFVLMYFFSVIFNDKDKHSGDWMIMETDEGITLYPLFDNEFIFYPFSYGMNFSVSFYDQGKSVVDSLKYFLSVSPKTYIDIFIGKFEIIENAIEEILTKIELQIKSKIPSYERRTLANNFKQHMRQIREIIDSFIVMKRKRR